MYSEPCQRSKIVLWKNKLAFNYFSRKKTLHLKSLRGYWISGFIYVRVLNILGLPIGRVLNFQGYTEFTYFRKCDRVSIIPWDVNKGFWIFQDSKCAWINCSGYGSLFECSWSKFHRVLNMPPVLNMPRLEICQSCEHARIMQGAEYAWISLNMS